MGSSLERSIAKFPPDSHREPIAIVGIGCRFPGGASDPESFWQLLIDGVDAVTEVPADRWNLRAFHDPESGKPGKIQSRWGGFLSSIDQFDPTFFGISHREAAWMDPQQRLLLETAWEAIEDGGQVLERLAGSRTAVYVGISSWDYSMAQTSFRDRGLIDVHTNTGGSLSIASNRIAYCLDFRGPSASVDTACSSALVAVHLACQSIWVEKCPLALAGGVNLLLMPDWSVGFSRLGMLSPHGRCRAFDARGDGFVRSEGAGMVLLKPLQQARTDGDRIYAIIRGTAVNQDGRTNGMTVPSQQAQEALVRQACDTAGIAPARIHFVEAHGTGTPVGDPIEARALGNVLSAGRSPERPCLLGSVKTNIGHLEAGAGSAGLIKAALAIYHRRLPGNLHFEKPNADIDFEGLKLRVPVRAESLPEDEPILAGINSFGFGGTNAHVILQSHEPDAPARESASPSLARRAQTGPNIYPVALSARSPDALRATALAMGQYVASLPAETPLYDLAANAAQRRTHHDHRLTVLARSKEELARRLGDFLAGQQCPEAIHDRAMPGARPKLAFVFSGQGPQWWAMGRQLLAGEPVFRETIERCDAIVRSLGEWSLLEELTRDEAKSRLNETAIAQPAIFALQAALTTLWRSWGVTPAAVVGHSVGEVAAAYAAGIYSLEDAVSVIYHRGRCMDRASTHGRMLAAALTTQEAERLLEPFGDRLSLAAVNSPSSVTLSGESEPLEEIARSLEERKIFCRFLQVEYAFHSAQMDPVRDELLPALAGIKPQRACLPFISTRDGLQLEGPELGPDYWWHNVRQTVRFADGVNRVVELGCDVALEVGPHPVLSAAVSECYQNHGKKVKVFPSLRRQEEERATMLRSLGHLHAAGYPIDWKGVFPRPYQNMRLPLNAWQRERCWHESEESRLSRLTAPVHPLLGCPRAQPGPTWEGRIDLRLLAYLGDHRVQRAVIMPATALVEAALAAARESFGKESCQIEDVKFSNPCFLTPDRPIRLQTSYQPETAAVSVHSRPAEDAADWTLHCRAIIRAHSEGIVTPAFDPEVIKQRCPRSFTGEQCFDYSRQLGLDYGPAFRGIVRAWQGKKESLGLVQLPEILAATADSYLFHPALLDACFQVGICSDRSFNDVVSGLYLPAEIDEVRLSRRPPRQVWCHARLLEKTARASVVDLDIYDQDGKPVLQLRGLRSQCVSGGSGHDSLDELLYAYRWEEQPRPEIAAAAHGPGANGNGNGKSHPRPAPDRWLIFADRGGVGKRVAEQLRAWGQSASLVFAGENFSSREPGHYEIDPGQVGDMARIFQEAGPSPWRGIVHLWNLDAPAANGMSSPQLAAAQETGLLSVVHLVQAWDQAVDNQTSRLFLVTRGAQALGDDAPLAMAQCPVIGLGRVITNEYPRLRCKLIDMDCARNQQSIQSLLDELAIADDEDEIALRGSARYVNRYVPAGRTAAPDASELTSHSGQNQPYRLTLSRPGTLDGMRLQSSRRQQPGPGNVEIEVAAAGLNFSDLMKVLGLYPGLQPGPVSLGAECSGRIVAVGDGVVDFQIGDEVIAVAAFAFGSHAITSAELVAHKPAGLSFEDGAAIPIVFLTAAYALDHLARLQGGERVLIHSASGGLGLAAVQLARRAGAEVFATAGTPEKRAFLQGLGIAHVLDSRTLAFADEVMARTAGQGVDVVLNSLAGEALVRSLDVLANYGRFLEVGKRDIYQNARLGLKPFRKNLSFFAIDLDRVMRDRPAFLGAMLRKLVAEFKKGELTPLPRQAFPIADVAGAFRCLQQAKHVGKIVLSLRDAPATVAPADDEPVTLHADASYLITGGLGGFGLAVARWMVDKGARHLVLVGRRGVASPETQQALDDLTEKGARVVVKQADITRQDEVATFLAEIDAGMPPLRGIMHAAMVLEDSLLLNLDDELMRRVLAPKVQGTWNLHLQTRGRHLDFFVMFSSLSSVFGHAGQGNYAAANLFLDALAHYRRGNGLPALTVNWGYLGEVGYLAQRPQLGERLERQGVMSFTVRQALLLLERAMRRNLTQVSVMRVDWSRWRGLGVTGKISPRFGHLLREKAEASTASGSLSPRDALKAADPAERSKLAAVLVRDRIAHILATTAAKIDAEKSLVQLGIDSLMAVELRNWIEEELCVALPIVELMRSPTLSHLAELVSKQLSTGLGADTNAISPAAPPDPDGPFPLSQNQRGLWLGQQVSGDSTAFNLALPIRLRFRLNLAAFRRALHMIVERHPALRTTFEQRNGQLLQRIHDAETIPLEVVDATAWSEEEINRRLDEEAHRPFDLERGPLLRMHLFARGPEDHIYLLAVHHVLGDFWSLIVMLEEMRQLYAAECEGVDANLPPIPKTYRDYVRWQEDLLGGPEGEQLWSYWQRQLAGVPAVLDLPTDRPRPAQAAHRGDVAECALSPELTRRLKAYAAAEHVTPYALLMSAFQVLLSRYSGQKSFLVGSPFAGRGRPEFANVVGYFVNLLPIRADLGGNPSARALARQVWQTVLDALAHQEFPFPLLAERLNVPRQSNRTPLVQALFVLEKAQRAGQRGVWGHFVPQQQGARTVDGLRLEYFSVEHRACEYDLEMILEDGDEAIEGMIRYDTDLFEPETIERFVGHFTNLLEAILAHPDRPVLELPMLSPSEHRLVVHDWNQTKQAYPPELCLHHLFEQQAQATPEAVALSGCGGQVTYGELERWSNALAHRLCDRGVQPESLVAMALERSPAAIAAILAVLKAGGAYVPLDPASPPDRLRGILEDVKPTLLLTQKDLVSRLPAVHAEVICVDALESLEGGSDQPPASRVGPENLAYVIFTSGTTERPKGVMVEHRSICNTILWQRDALPVRADDRYVSPVPYFFDASICSIFTTLTRGACLVLPELGDERDPGRLVETIIRSQATIAESVPGLLRLMIDHPRFLECQQLRWMCTGGEAVPPDLPGRLFDRLPIDFYNLYGPTEAAVEATWYKCQPDDSRSSVPIGRPIANTQIYILDEFRRPVAIGVPGELWIGGAGVARGYLNKPDQTADRFLTDPFCNESNARIYRTGDRCRWRADGTLEYLGRLDQQVKVSGYRIELEEIESLLAGMPEIQEAAVTVHGDGMGMRRLVAYVVPRPDAVAPAFDRLRQYLAEKLPKYALPSALVTLPSLPYTANGKLDRKALPVPILERPKIEQPYVAPAGPLQEFLAKLWAEMLRVDKVGVDDNFFELGGSSILGVRMINQVQETVGEHIYVVALFEAPTIAGLARHLEETYPDQIHLAFGAGEWRNDAPLHANGEARPRSATSDLIVPLQPRGTRPPLFVVHPPGGIVACYQPLARVIGNEQPLYAIRSRGLKGERDLPARLEDMAAEYVDAIGRAQSHGPYHLAGWSMGGVIAFEMAQQFFARGEHVGLLALLDTAIPQNEANRPFVGDEDLSWQEYGLDKNLDELAKLGPDEQLPYLWDHAQKMGVVDKDTPLSLVQRLLDDLKRLFHAHIELGNAYAVRPYPGRITLFRPLDAPVRVPLPEDRGWRQLARAVDVYFVPGQHHSMVQDPHVHALAERLRACLDATSDPNRVEMSSN